MALKRVRILLRVSSDQQLEANGDLSIQRQLVVQYIQQHENWILDSKEYFEGSKSGYKNSIADRNILQEALADAKKGEYDILAIYKDDRLGRKMFDTCRYIMNLKEYNVDVYSVKDGLITPASEDPMDKIMVSVRYAVAEKSSLDTGMRVKDNAKELVKDGKFMGGNPPYGYTLEFSGKYSKHQRALKHLVINSKQAKAVKHIYNLSFYKEFGSAKIARILNTDDEYKHLAPTDVWKSGTITSILTNPIYTGYITYNRRERIGKHHYRLDKKDWIMSEKQNEDITIIDIELWQNVQIKRYERGQKYKKIPQNANAVVITRNDGELALIDVAYCGYCGCKLTNGTKYDYWTIKSTGERRSSRKAIYKCQNLCQGVPHPKMKQILANKIEPIVFETLIEYIEKLQENEFIFEQIIENQNKDMEKHKKQLTKEKRKLNDIQRYLELTQDEIPNALAGTCQFSLEDLAESIERQKEQKQQQIDLIKQLEIELKNMTVSVNDWESLQSQIPSWREIFLTADTARKRVLVDRLIERIEITDEQVIIRFKINLNDFFVQPRISNVNGVPESGL